MPAKINGIAASVGAISTIQQHQEVFSRPKTLHVPITGIAIPESKHHDAPPAAGTQQDLWAVRLRERAAGAALPRMPTNAPPAAGPNWGPGPGSGLKEQRNLGAVTRKSMRLLVLALMSLQTLPQVTFDLQSRQTRQHA